MSSLLDLSPNAMLAQETSMASFFAWRETFLDVIFGGLVANSAILANYRCHGGNAGLGFAFSTFTCRSKPFGSIIQ